MRRLLSVILMISLCFGLAGARAEQDSFLVSDWKLLYSFEGTPIAEQFVYIYEDGTFDVADGDDSLKGTWTFDGETLVLTADDEALSLAWNAEARQFTGEYNSMAITMEVPIEAESGEAAAEPAAEAPEGGMLMGGWAVAEDQTITDDLNNIFFQGLDSYQTGIITVAYTPVALLATQVVAGTNYAVLSKASEINQGSKWVIIYLYQDLEGNATVLKIADVELGI